MSLHRDELLAVYESGRPLPSTILGLTINGDDVENSGLVWEVGDIDCRAYPISGSLQRMRWRLIPTATYRSACTPLRACPPLWPTLGICSPGSSMGSRPTAIYPVMAAELEFYLLDQKPDSNGRPRSTQV